MLRRSWLSLFLVLMSAPVGAQEASAPNVDPPSASVPLAGQPAPNAADWQDVIAAQIQAFRDHDAPKALSFAGAAFHQSYADPQAFFDAIMRSGYAPIMQSASQSFGRYQMLDAEHVVQEVKLTGTDQTVYEAVYQMAKEAGGWRVYGVELAKTQALGV